MGPAATPKQPGFDREGPATDTRGLQPSGDPVTEDGQATLKVSARGRLRQLQPLGHRVEGDTGTDRPLPAKGQVTGQKAGRSEAVSDSIGRKSDKIPQRLQSQLMHGVQHVTGTGDGAGQVFQQDTQGEPGKEIRRLLRGQDPPLRVGHLGHRDGSQAGWGGCQQEIRSEPGTGRVENAAEAAVQKFESAGIEERFTIPLGFDRSTD